MSLPGERPLDTTPRSSPAAAHLLAGATCLFFVIGGVSGLLLTWTPHLPGAQIGIMRVVALGAAMIGPGLLLARDVTPAWLYQVLNPLGSTVVFAALWLSGGGELAVALASLYVMVSLHSFAFFRPRTAMLLTAYAWVLAGVAGWPLGLLPVQLVLTSALVNAVAAGVVMWLVRSAERADRDGVTGLPNRQGVDRELELALVDARRESRTFTVGYLDLDHFRRVNETEGRAAGDAILRAVGRHWGSMLPEGASLAHCGGGEFVVLLPGLDAEAAGRTIEAMRSSLPHLGTASAGLAEWRPEDTTSLLLSRADASLYRAKRAGRNRIDPRVGLSVTIREMRQALRHGSFLVLFQPIVDLRTDVVLAAEALVRWNHPTRGRINPADFIPLAEESGVIVELGRQVLEQACTAVMEAEREGRYLGTVTVNVAGRQLQELGYAEEVLDILAETGLAPARLVLEVTESSLAAEEGRAVAALTELRRHGISIAIDDFGTGYSSLSRLATLPVDILKIDRSFVRSTEPGRPAPIIASITALADALGLSTVAEGIEYPEQAAVLADHGCHRGQGWLYGRPATMDQLQLPPTTAAASAESAEPSAAAEPSAVATV